MVIKYICYSDIILYFMVFSGAIWCFFTVISKDPFINTLWHCWRCFCLWCLSANRPVCIWETYTVYRQIWSPVCHLVASGDASYLLRVIPCPQVTSLQNSLISPSACPLLFFNLAISSGISYSRLITWSCLILWCVIYPEEQIVDKIKDKQAAFARAFVPGPGLPSLLGEISR